jgi:hypothetical protein
MDMPGASWAQRREEFAEFAESHDIAEQGLDVELRQLSRKHQFGKPSTKGYSLEPSALKAEPGQQDTNSKSIFIANDAFFISNKQISQFPL